MACAGILPIASEAFAYVILLVLQMPTSALSSHDFVIVWLWLSCDSSSALCFADPCACRDLAVPKKVEGLQGVNVIILSGGWRHAVAADDQGRMYGWGWNKVTNSPAHSHMLVFNLMLVTSSEPKAAAVGEEGCVGGSGNVLHEVQEGHCPLAHPLRNALTCLTQVYRNAHFPSSTHMNAHLHEHVTEIMHLVFPKHSIVELEKPVLDPIP